RDQVLVEAPSWIADTTVQAFAECWLGEAADLFSGGLRQRGSGFLYFASGVEGAKGRDDSILAKSATAWFGNRGGAHVSERATVLIMKHAIPTAIDARSETCAPPRLRPGAFEGWKHGFWP